jgi:serine phosphatase RsbU (regulator of sigma subunit)
MNADTTRHIDLELRAVAGPTAVAFRLVQPGPMTIGRRSANALQLNDPAVSRDHARLSFRPSHQEGEASAGEWLLDDLGSTHGTWLNGVPVRPKRQYHLRAGDLMVIGPWTLLVADRAGSSRPETTLATFADAAMVGTIVSRVERSTDEVMQGQGLRLLQSCAERIHAARDERAVADAILEAATEGTQFTRIAVLRPMTDGDEVEAIALCGDDSGTGPVSRLSRALIHEAASGSPAQLRREAGGRLAATADAEMEDAIALCLPIMVESTLVGFLYLDRPVNEPKPGRAARGSVAFPLALARLAAMGMANLMRIDIERRHERMESELQASMAARKLLLPQREGRVGPYTYAGETRQGHCIGGDFFDIIPLDGGRLAVVVGDVGGRGIPVSVLVSASQGFLHACLEERGDPALAVDGINRLFHTRITDPRFLKLWVGVFDAWQRSLCYAAAGPAWAMTVTEDGRCEPLTAEKQPPVGMEPSVKCQAHTTPIPAGARVLVLSDGFIEQRAQDTEDDQADASEASTAESQPARFGINGVKECLRRLQPGEDEIAALVLALERHAGTTVFDDDATAVVVRL